MSHALTCALLGFTFMISGCGTATPNSTNNALPNNSSSSGAPCPSPSDPNLKILISTPCENAIVAQRSFVGGTVSDANAQVWVVIHPMETSDYWVQPAVTIRDGGRWKVLCYFGEPGQHSGKPYEVQAFMNPKETLREGQMLSAWPAAEAKSQSIEVKRE